MTSSKKGRQILQLILFLLKKLALPGSGEAVDLVSEVDLGESVYRVYFEAVDSVSEAAASRPYSLLSRLLLNRINHLTNRGINMNYIFSRQPPLATGSTQRKGTNSNFKVLNSRFSRLMTKLSIQ